MLDQGVDASPQAMPKLHDDPINTPGLNRLCTLRWTDLSVLLCIPAAVQAPQPSTQDSLERHHKTEQNTSTRQGESPGPDLSVVMS